MQLLPPSRRAIKIVMYRCFSWLLSHSLQQLWRSSLDSSRFREVDQHLHSGSSLWGPVSSGRSSVAQSSTHWYTELVQARAAASAPSFWSPLWEGRWEGYMVCRIKTGMGIVRKLLKMQRQREIKRQEETGQRLGGLERENKTCHCLSFKKKSSSHILAIAHLRTCLQMSSETAQQAAHSWQQHSKFREEHKTLVGEDRHREAMVFLQLYKCVTTLLCRNKSVQPARTAHSVSACFWSGHLFPLTFSL